MGLNSTWRGGLVVAVGVAAVLGTVLPALPAWGRAGGGEGFGGGDSTGDGLPVELVIYLVRLCWYRPAIGLPIAAALVLIMVVSWKTGRSSYRTHIVRRGTSAMWGNLRASAVRSLRTEDPAFDEAAFLARVCEAFLRLQRAWAAQDLAPARLFISDGVYERFALQIQEQRARGFRNAMEGLTVCQADLACHECAGPFDVVDVRIAAAAADYRVSLEDGRILSGSREVVPFVEYWSFLRRRGARTQAGKPGLFEGNCPNCGAPLEMNQSTNCTSCGALLRSGVYDWVLTEITQASEWAPRIVCNVPGLAELLQRDPGFTVQHLEDRASVMFWRRALADLRGDVRTLHKIATEEFCQRYSSGWTDRQRRVVFGDCAVGGVDTLGFLAGATLDRALVQISWAGSALEVAPDGSMHPTGNRLLTESLYILGRQPTVRSQLERAVCSAHCPTCGAPEMQATSSTCEFCGQVLNDGSGDWVLLDIVSPRSEAGRALLGQLGPDGALFAGRAGPAQVAPGRGLAQIAWMIEAFMSDGQLGPQEHRMLAEAAARRGVSCRELEQMIGASQRGQLEVPGPRDRAEALDCLETMAAAALVDGSLCKTEQTLLQRVAAQYGFAPYDLRLIIRRHLTEMYVAARQELRRARDSSAGPGIGP